MEIIQEGIAETEQDTAEGAELLAGTETETENTWDKNVMHPYLQVPALTQTYNLWL